MLFIPLAVLLAAPPCDGLRAVQIFPSANPEWSVAVLSNGKEAVFRRRGGAFDGKTIVSVDEESVLLQSDGGQCRAYINVPTTRLPERSITRAELEAILE